MGLLDFDINKVLGNDAFMLGAAIQGSNSGHYGAFGPALQGGLNNYAMQKELMRRQQQQQQQQEWMNANGYGGMPADFALAKYKSDNRLTDTNNFGLNPVFDDQGNAYQLSKDGSARAIKLPNNAKVQRPLVLKDFGPYIGGVDSITANVTNVGNKGLAPENLPSTRAAQTRATEEAKLGVEKAANKVKAQSSASSKFYKSEMLNNMIDEADNMAGFWTTGLIGSGAKQFPGTKAYDLSKKLDTIRANIGFDRLQEMRDNSPTGGALGQVSEMENRLLQAVWGNLEQSQSEEQFKQNLELVKQQVARSWKNVADAYEKDYGEQLNFESETPQYSEEDIKFTAKKYNMTEEQVRQKLGIK